LILSTSQAAESLKMGKVWKR